MGVQIPARVVTDAARRLYNTEGVEGIRTTHATWAAAASLTAAIPVAGTIISIGITTATVWHMYYEINKELGIYLSENVLKSIASAVVSNIASNIGGLVLAEAGAAVISTIPIFGSVTAAIVCASVNYATVYIAGSLYMAVLQKMAGKNLSEVSEDGIKSALSEELSSNRSFYEKSYSEQKKKAKDDIKNGKISKDDAVDFRDEF